MNLTDKKVKKSQRKKKLNTNLNDIKMKKKSNKENHHASSGRRRCHPSKNPPIQRCENDWI